MNSVFPINAPPLLQIAFWGSAAGLLFSVYVGFYYASAQRRFKIRNYFRPQLVFAVGSALCCLAVAIGAYRSAVGLTWMAPINSSMAVAGAVIQIISALKSSRRKRQQSKQHHKKVVKDLSQKGPRG